MVGQFGRSLDDPHYIVSHTFENIHQSFSGFPFRISLTNKPGGLGKMSPPKSTRLTCRDLKSSETGSVSISWGQIQKLFPTPSSSCPTENPTQSTVTMRARRGNPDHFGFYTDLARRPAGTFPTITQKFISPILHALQLMLPYKSALPSIHHCA